MTDRVYITLNGISNSSDGLAGRPWWAHAEIDFGDVSITISTSRCATPWECFDRITAWAAKLLARHPLCSCLWSPVHGRIWCPYCKSEGTQ